MPDKQKSSTLSEPLAPLAAVRKRRSQELVVYFGNVYLLEDAPITEHDDPEYRIERFVFCHTYLCHQLWAKNSKLDVQASEMCAGRRITSEDVIRVLRQIPWRHWANAGRANVRPAGVHKIDSITLGLVACRSTQGKTLPSLKTRRFPNLCRLLLRFWKQSLMDDPAFERSGCRDLVCTSIQLNRNYAAREHVDGNNLGPSWLIALGDFTTGGELFVEDPAGSEVHRLRDDVWSGNTWRLRQGELCRGKSLQAHNCWARFDGRRMHFVREYSGGDRYSLVFFCAARHMTVPPIARATLMELGFPLPLPGSKAVDRKFLPLGSVLRVDSEGRVMDDTPTVKPNRKDSETWTGTPIESTGDRAPPKKRRRLRLKQPSPDREELEAKMKAEAAAQAAADEWARVEADSRAAAAAAAEAAYRAAKSAEPEQRESKISVEEAKRLVELRAGIRSWAAVRNAETERAVEEYRQYQQEIRRRKQQAAGETKASREAAKAVAEAAYQAWKAAQAEQMKSETPRDEDSPVSQ
mmetsp:Transcript_82440/g.145454  ORF Transcript_82440/g.145454 Transcript_82440/m.145454 type:complete len:523 (+) Transcript_82440:64-1632(+)